jgi:hypothetical protein
MSNPLYFDPSLRPRFPPAAACVPSGLLSHTGARIQAAGFNLWVGVARAGYPLADEIPFFLVVFAVPAGATALLWWEFSRG